MYSDELHEFVSMGANVFDILKVSGNEIRHSNFLAWLLDPLENHGLRDKFVKEFLQEVIKNDTKHENALVQKSEKSEAKRFDFIDSYLCDFSDIQVRREYRSIDILCTSPKNKVNLIIENKIWSSDHDSQLHRYRELVQNEFPPREFANIFVYLTPYGEEPVEEPDEGYYLLGYEQILEIIQGIGCGENLQDNVRFILDQYQENIKRNLLMTDNEKLKEIAAKVYAVYKPEIDLVIDNRPDNRDKMIDTVETILDEFDPSREWLIYDPKKNVKQWGVRFRSKWFDEVLSNRPSGKKPWGDGSLYYYEIGYWNDINNGEASDIRLSINLVFHRRGDETPEQTRVQDSTIERFFENKKEKQLMHQEIALITDDLNSLMNQDSDLIDLLREPMLAALEKTKTWEERI
jgi:hypothetical protein